MDSIVPQNADLNQAVQAAPEWPLRIKLAKPIPNVDNLADPLTELVLREPTAADIAACGNPMRYVAGVEPDYNVPAMNAMIARLSTQAPSVIGKLNPRDWNSLAFALAPNFLPRWEALTTLS
jgi:hypothetical protein